MYKEFPSHPHGTESRSRRSTFLENSVFGFTCTESYSRRACGESLLRQPRCARGGRGRRRSVLRGRGGGNGGESESGIGQGGRARGGARRLEVPPRPQAHRALGPGHRRVPIERATLLALQRRRRRRPRLRAAGTVQRAARSGWARWWPSSGSATVAGAWP